jgi:hypothetical protein
MLKTVEHDKYKTHSQLPVLDQSFDTVCFLLTTENVSGRVDHTPVISMIFPRETNSRLARKIVIDLYAFLRRYTILMEHNPLHKTD